MSGSSGAGSWLSRLRIAARNITLAGSLLMFAIGALRFSNVEHTLLFGAVPLAPLVGVFGFVVFGALTGMRTFVGAVTASLIAVGLALPGTLVPRTGCDVTRVSDGSIVVYSHNVLIGNSDVVAVSSQIESVAPDVVVLQETGSDFADALFDRLDGEYPHTMWERNQAFLSKWPLQEEHQVTLVEGTKPMLVGTVETSVAAVTIANFHSDPPFRPELRANQKQQFEILATDPSFDDIDVLIGDFNAPSSDKRYRELRSTRFTDGHRSAGCGLGVTWSPTVDGGPALLSLDHALLANGFEAESFQVLDFAGSDHKAIAVRIAPGS